MDQFCNTFQVNSKSHSQGKVCITDQRSSLYHAVQITSISSRRYFMLLIQQIGLFVWIGIKKACKIAKTLKKSPLLLGIILAQPVYYAFQVKSVVFVKIHLWCFWPFSIPKYRVKIAANSLKLYMK